MARLFRRTKTPARAENIDELTKLNRGGSTFVAEDSGTNPGYILPFNKTSKTMMQAGIQPRQSQFTAPEVAPDPVMEDDQTDTNTNPQQPMSIQDFMDTYNTEPQAIGQTPDGGLILPDGTTVYEGGQIKNQQGQEIYGMASIPGGYTMYSDGSIRAKGLEGLIQGIFNQHRAITQGYGNRNTGMGYKNNIHRGIDIRTRDLTGEQRNLRLPVDAQVVETLNEQDGSLYGNSILLQMADGQMLRFSHLATPPRFQAGQTVPAYESFGIPGSTGNSDAEHLDLEYYTADGQISDPNMFTGFPGANLAAGQSIPPEMMTSELQQYADQIRNNPPQEPIASPIQQNQSIPQPQGQVLGTQDVQPSITPYNNPAINQESKLPLTLPNPNLGTAVNQLGRDLNLPGVSNPEGFLGVGELAAGSRSLAGQEINNTGTRNNLPKLGIGEAVAGNYGAAKQELGGTLAEAKSRFEAKLNGIRQRIEPSVQQTMDRITPDAYAADLQDEQQQQRPQGQVLGATDTANEYADQSTQPVTRFMDQTMDAATTAAGAGINKLKGLFSRTNVQDRPNMSDLGGDKQVGMSPTAPMSISSTPQSMMNSQKPTDTRDPFFKGDMSKQYASFMNPTATDNKTLTMDMFKPEFYNDNSRVSSVFGNSYMKQPAEQKYTDNRNSVINDYRTKYSGGDYDQADMEAIINNLPSNADLSAMSIPAPKYSYADAYSPSPWNDQGSSNNNNQSSNQSSSDSHPAVFSGPNQNASKAPAPKSYPAITSGPKQNASPVKYSPPPMSKPAPKPQPAPQPQPSLFDRAIQTISRFFRR